jgi:hypothetical protein
MKNLEELQKEKLGFGYIKSYPILKQLNIKPLELDILQLVLSYTDNDKVFFMSHDKIANILSSTESSIGNTISKLKKKNYIITYHSTNYNGKDGGSSTTIKVNMEYIIHLLTSNELSNESDSLIPQEVKQSVKSKKKDIEEKQVEKKHSQQYLDEINNKQD